MVTDDDFYRTYFGMDEVTARDYFMHRIGDNGHARYLRDALKFITLAEEKSNDLPATALGNVCTAIASAELAKKFGVGADITDTFIEAATRKKQQLHDRLENGSKKSL